MVYHRARVKDPVVVRRGEPGLNTWIRIKTTSTVVYPRARVKDPVVDRRLIVHKGRIRSEHLDPDPNTPTLAPLAMCSITDPELRIRFLSEGVDPV